MELAAMASAAVPGLAPTGVAGSPDDAADFDAALLVDDAGRRWRVRSPKHLEASMRLETELLVLRTFVPAVRAELPFALPYVAGTVRQGELCTFVYSHLPGATRSIDALMTSGRSVAEEIGRAMAAIHGLPRELVTRADLPSYTANEFRQRRLNELDQAATTGLIPSVLLRRWEHALEDVSLWRFKPTVVHGDLHEDNILLTGERVSAVTGWTDLRVGDPADDFAWLIAANDPRFTETVHGAYLQAATDPEDPHLIRRAALSAEFALAQWLVRGVAAENSTMVDEAVEMLGTLEEDVLAQEAADKRSGQSRAAEARAAAARPVPSERPASASGKVTVAPIDPQETPLTTPGGAADASGRGNAADSGTGVSTEDADGLSADAPAGPEPANSRVESPASPAAGVSAAAAPHAPVGDPADPGKDVQDNGDIQDNGDEQDSGETHGAAAGQDSPGQEPAESGLAKVIMLPSRSDASGSSEPAGPGVQIDAAPTSPAAADGDRDTEPDGDTDHKNGTDRDSHPGPRPEPGTATTALPLTPVRDT